MDQAFHPEPVHGTAKSKGPGAIVFSPHLVGCWRRKPPRQGP